MYICNCCGASVTFIISSIDERLEFVTGDIDLTHTVDISSLYTISKKRKRDEDDNQDNICRKKLKKC